MIRKADSRHIGSCSVWEESAQHKRGGLGFVFHPDVWGQGYATETAGLLLQVGLERLGLVRLEETCRPENVGSRRALEKAGFAVEGLLRGHVLLRGVRQDSLVLSALRENSVPFPRLHELKQPGISLAFVLDLTGDRADQPPHII